MIIFKASVTIDDHGWFVIDVPEVGVTQARYSYEVEPMVRDLIECQTELCTYEFFVEVEFCTA